MPIDPYVLLDELADGFYQVDLRGHFQFVNRRLCQMLGYTRDEIIGTPTRAYRRFLEPESVRRAARAFQEVYQYGVPAPLIIVHALRHDGTMRLFEVSIALTRSEQEHPIGFCGTVRDITERMQQYEQTRLQVDQKSELIQVGIHRLINILALVKGFLDLLYYDIEPHLQGEAARYWETSQEHLTRLERLAKHMLELERLDQRQKTMRQLDLVPIVSRIVDEYRDEFVRRDLMASVDLESDALIISGVGTDMADAVTNLISNAIKYTSAGGRIDIRLLRRGAFAAFEVEDTGIGVPQNTQANLFQPFNRAVNTAGISGNGLGLNIVKRAVERHSGRMLFHSVQDQGSLFGFEIPLVSIDPAS